MKKSLTMAIALAVASMSASAVVLTDYQFNDAQGTGFESAANLGTLSFTNGITPVVANGSGAMGISGITTADNSATADLGLSSDITAGVITLEAQVSDWNFSGVSYAGGRAITFDVGKSRMKFEVTASGFRSNGSPKDGFFRIFDQGSKSKLSLDDFDGTGNTLGLRMTVDLDAGTYDTEYNLDGAGFTALSTGTAYGSNLVDKISVGILSKDLDWDVGESMKLDYVTVNHVVPEPATMGTMAVFGAAIFFVRRRFA